MPDSINRRLVDRILMGPPGRRRHLQDSPILPDVWFSFADAPSTRQELLLTPHYTSSASAVAVSLARDLVKPKAHYSGDHRITPLQGIVAVNLNFREMISHIIPKTLWWDRLSRDLFGQGHPDILAEIIVSHMAADLGRYAQKNHELDIPPIASQFLFLCGLISSAPDNDWGDFTTDDRVIIPPNVQDKTRQEIYSFLMAFFGRATAEGDGPSAIPDSHKQTQTKHRQALVWSVSQNRTTDMSLHKSAAAIKADATRNLFNIDCSGLTWAVIDSGIDSLHPAFQKQGERQSGTRVLTTYDFTRIRDIASVDFTFLPADVQEARVTELSGLFELAPDDVRRRLKKLAEDAEEGMELNWELIEPFLAPVDDGSGYKLEHGTHVAGIIGANWYDKDNGDIRLQGVCPDINLMDLRVIGDDLQQTEIGLIAALQYIRHANARSNHKVVHGANISLSIPHNVRNYACGGTPVCVEAEALAASGVCVVTAAGNRGYQHFETTDGPSFSSYAAFSITDPGNAEGVITVGSTHRNWPHTYGVSFFSSRGPTGDGRPKPDLVAPGEKITSTAPGAGIAVMDGTSMAAPHVSGAAALMMARYPELIGQSARIKQVLVDNATDLGRERSFQGAGMLDILRAIQAV